METETEETAIRAEIIARWNARQQRENLFTNIDEAQIRRAVKRELARRQALRAEQSGGN